MALNFHGRFLLPTMAVAILLGLGSALAWGQAAGNQDLGGWRQKLAGSLVRCRARLHALVDPLPCRGFDDTIMIRYRAQPFSSLLRADPEPVGRWTIKATITSGPNKGLEFDATVSELDDLKEIVQGKFKGSLTAKIQTAEIEGIRVKETSGISISGAKIDEPKIDKPKIDAADVSKFDAPKAAPRNKAQASRSTT